MPKLTLVMERTPIQVYEIGRPIIQVGRTEGMEIVIDNVSVSRQQCELRQDGRYWSVKDLGSTNGTFLNGQRLTGSERLKPGDEISFGKFSLFFERELDAPVAGASIVPSPGQARPPGTYALGAEELERLQQAIADKRRAQLEWEAVGLTGTYYITTDSVLIGPGERSQLRIVAGPKKGLLVTRVADGYEIRNLAGVLDFARMRVNGKVTRSARLRTGDVIQIGQVRLTFHDEVGRA
jgi:predicted component of type VI protein secretion system